MQELPVIEAVHRDHRDRGVVVLADNVGGNAVDELSLTATRYGVGAFPTVVVIDRRGQLRARLVGQVPKAKLAALL